MTTYILGITFIIAISLSNILVQWKLGTNKANAEATDTWKELAGAKDEKVKQLEERVALLETKYRAIEKENIGLTKEVNILKQVKPSEAFEKSMQDILNEMKLSRNDFLQHASNDADQFEKMWQRIETTNDVALNNNRMLQKLCKEV